MLIRPLIAASAIILVSGCVAIGGSKRIGVRGALPEAAGKCSLDFVSAVTGRTKMTQPVQGNFCSGVIISGGFAQQYHFVARCPDGNVYRSRSVEIGIADDFVEIDLLLANGDD